METDAHGRTPKWKRTHTDGRTHTSNMDMLPAISRKWTRTDGRTLKTQTGAHAHGKTDANAKSYGWDVPPDVGGEIAARATET